VIKEKTLQGDFIFLLFLNIRLGRNWRSDEIHCALLENGD
jgi:hypothetical protein